MTGVTLERGQKKEVEAIVQSDQFERVIDGFFERTPKKFSLESFTDGKTKEHVLSREHAADVARTLARLVFDIGRHNMKRYNTLVAEGAGALALTWFLGAVCSAFNDRVMVTNYGTGMDDDAFKTKHIASDFVEADYQEPLLLVTEQIVSGDTVTNFLRALEAVKGKSVDVEVAVLETQRSEIAGKTIHAASGRGDSEKVFDESSIATWYFYKQPALTGYAKPREGQIRPVVSELGRKNPEISRQWYDALDFLAQSLVPLIKKYD